MNKPLIFLKKYWLLLVVIAVVIAVSAAFIFNSFIFNDAGVRQIPIGPIIVSFPHKVTVWAELADTPQKQQIGLSNREKLDEQSGMLFVLSTSHIPAFWMKGMKIPLDMIWIDHTNTVTHIHENVPAPDPQTPLMLLPRYSPDKPVNKILEVNAGFCKKYGIRIGDAVIVKLN